MLGQLPGILLLALVVLFIIIVVGLLWEDCKQVVSCILIVLVDEFQYFVRMLYKSPDVIVTCMVRFGGTACEAAFGASSPFVLDGEGVAKRA